MNEIHLEDGNTIKVLLMYLHSCCNPMCPSWCEHQWDVYVGRTTVFIHFFGAQVASRSSATPSCATGQVSPLVCGFWLNNNQPTALPEEFIIRVMISAFL